MPHAKCPRVAPPVGPGRNRSTDTASHPDSAAESLPNFGNVVARRQDTSHTRVQVVKTFVGDLQVAQVFDSYHLLPRTFGEERVLQTPETSPISES